MRLGIPSLILTLTACGSDKAITVFNPAPKAEISSHSDGDEVLEGMVITLEGNVTDANHQAEELTVTWKSGTDILCETVIANSDGSTSCEAVLNPENTEITLEVKDAENSPGSDTITITVIPSANPVAEIIAPESGGVYYSDQLITFEALLSDEEDAADQLVAFWESNRDGDLTDVDAEPDSSGSILGYGYLTEGEHAIELTVEDTTGKTNRASVIIDVGPPNSAPLCQITEPIDGSAGPEGDAVQFVATASDVDVPSDMLTVTWSSDKDGDIGSSVPNSVGAISFSYADLSVNTHNISMQVTDEVGETCTATLNYTVGTPPSISIDAPIDGETYSAGDALSFAATVSDAQDQPDEIALNWSLNGTSISSQGSTSTGTAQFSDATLAYGAYNLIVTATDTDGLTDSDQINFTINGLPTQPVISIDPDPADTNDTLTVSIDTPSSDPEGSAVNYTYEWLMGGAVQSSYTSSTVPSSATNKNEQWTVRVTPNDGIADGPVGEATITIANTAPTLSALAIAPTSNVYNDITLTCSVVVTDPDETLTPTFEWSVGSTVVGSGSTLDLSSAGAMPNDVVTCSVSVVDGDGETAFDSTTTTVENRFPEVDMVSLSPSVVYTNDTITATAVFSDDDTTQTVSGTYAWHVVDFATGTDTEVQSGVDNTLSGLAYFDRDDDVYVVVTPNDGVDDGVSMASNSITISNTEPTTPVVSIAPDPAAAGQDDLLCSVDTPSSDDDGDTVVYTYVWTDDSGSVQQTTTESAATSDIFLASGTSEGTWACTVTPSDMTSTGVAASAAVAISSGCSSLNFQSESLTIPASSDFVFSSTLTMETWLKWENDNSNWYPIVQHGWGTGDSLFFFALTGTEQGCGVTHDTGTPYFEFKTAMGGHCFYADAGLPEHEWVHVAVVFDSGLLRMFVQGTEVKSQSVSSSQLSTVPAVDLKIGYSPTSGNSYFYGNLSHLQLNSTARYSADFSLSSSFVHDSNTVAFWKLDEGAGTVVYDSTGNGHDGLNNGALWDNTCPEEDLDGDGYFAWEDCDDGDVSVYPFAGDTYGDGVDSDCDGLDCEAASDGSTYFAACPDSMNKSDASLDCMNAGYDGLATVNNQAEDFFIQVLRVTQGSYWLGLTDIAQEGVWKWADGSLASYTNWAPGEPNNQSNAEHCVVLAVDYRTQWNDVPCGLSSQVGWGGIGRVCEKR